MKPIFFHKRSLSYGLVFFGVVLIAAGLFQFGNSYYGAQVVMEGEPLPGQETTAKEDETIKNGNKPGSTIKNQFFVEYRLERERTRSQQIDLLREIVNNQNSSEETRKEANRRLLAISQSIDTEMKLENLIRAENFKDAVAFVQEKSATVIVQAPILTELDKKRLTEIAVRVTGFSAENIVVISKV